MPIRGQIERHCIILVVNIIIYTFQFLSYFMISVALREAYGVGEKLDKLHMAMVKGVYSSRWQPCSNKVTTDRNNTSWG